MILVPSQKALVQGSNGAVSMKNKTQQASTDPATQASVLPTLESERRARLQLQQLFSQQPELCLQVIRRWLGSDSSPKSSTPDPQMNNRPPRPR